MSEKSFARLHKQPWFMYWSCMCYYPSAIMLPQYGESGINHYTLSLLFWPNRVCWKKELEDLHFWRNPKTCSILYYYLILHGEIFNSCM